MPPNGLVLQRDDLLALLRDDFELTLRIIALLTERLRYTMAYSQQLAFLSGPGRVATTLLHLASVEAQSDGPARLELTQQELADFTSTTREWVNHVLRDFAAQRLVVLERGAVIVLDRARLGRMIRRQQPASRLTAGEAFRANYGSGGAAFARIWATSGRSRNGRSTPGALGVGSATGWGSTSRSSSTQARARPRIVKLR